VASSRVDRVIATEAEPEPDPDAEPARRLPLGMRVWSWWLMVIAACAPPPPPAGQRPPARTGAPAPTATAPSDEPSEPKQPAAEAPSTPPPDAGQLVPLKVDGFEDAVVAVPVQAPTPRPLLVATHGNFDRPEWQCREWQRIAGDQVFVLCPGGVARPDSPSREDRRFTYASNAALERELDAALAALRARYGEWVDTTAAVYTGFSLGAILGVKIASRRADLFPRLALVEGGFEEWTAARARAFVSGGGKRVLFLCGQKACVFTARRLSHELEKLGLAVRVATSPGLGHTYGGPMTELARTELPWLVADDARWQKSWLHDRPSR
jgi:dienelactone hydrolase